MLQIVRSIYKMTGQMVRLPEDEDTPEKRVDKIFAAMDLNHDHQLTYDEFKEGSKHDPTIVQVSSAEPKARRKAGRPVLQQRPAHHSPPLIPHPRRCPSTTAWCKRPARPAPLACRLSRSVRSARPLVSLSSPVSCLSLSLSPLARIAVSLRPV